MGRRARQLNDPFRLSLTLNLLLEIAFACRAVKTSQFSSPVADIQNDTVKQLLAYSKVGVRSKA